MFLLPFLELCYCNAVSSITGEKGSHWKLDTVAVWFKHRTSTQET